MTLKASKARFSIYVIDLHKDVLSDKKFMSKNRRYVSGKPCVYVGMTARTPEERFRQHQEGYKSARIAKKFGRCLKPRQFQSHNPMTYEDAMAMEAEKARRLRARGWGVWQN